MDIKNFELWLVENELSDNTIESYKRSVLSYFENFDEVSKKNIIAWKRLLSRDHAPTTVNLRLCGILKYCEYKGLEFKVKQVKTQKIASNENVITIEEYGKICEYLESKGKLHHKLMIRILATTGARISEALQIKWGDITSGYADISNKGKVRRLYFNDEIKREAAAMLPSEPEKPVFTNKYNRQITTRGFDQLLKTYGKKCGIEKNKMHAHSFRHLFAIEFLKRNNNIALLADVLGHSEINTTRIYLKLSEGDQINILKTTVDW